MESRLKYGADIIPLAASRSGRSRAILGLVQGRVGEKLDFLLQGLSINIADALFEEMKELTRQDALKHHFNIMREMRVGEAQFRDRYHEVMDKVWLDFPDNMTNTVVPGADGPVAELMASFAERTANHYKVLLRETGQRLQTLLGRKVGRHPLYPDLYYQAFWVALAEMNLTYSERCFIVPLFHRFVMDRYGQVLSAANRTLIEHRVDITVMD